MMVSITPLAICASWATRMGPPSSARVFHSVNIWATRPPLGRVGSGWWCSSIGTAFLIHNNGRITIPELHAGLAKALDLGWAGATIGRHLEAGRHHVGLRRMARQSA